MNKRLTFFAVIEGIILLFLLVALLRNGFVLFFVTALVLSWLAGRSRSCLLGLASGVFWLVTIFHLIGSGYFWLALLFPVVLGLYYYRSRGAGRGSSPKPFFHRSMEGRNRWAARRNLETEQLNSQKTGDNELIDLADLHFHSGGNNLSIRKSMGNTKIVVPEDVELSLNIQVQQGVVKIFDQKTEINDVNLRYFTPNYESADKRVAMSIKVASGNVELVRG